MRMYTIVLYSSSFNVSLHAWACECRMHTCVASDLASPDWSMQEEVKGFSHHCCMGPSI